MPLIDPALRELAGLYQISTELWDLTSSLAPRWSDEADRRDACGS